MHVAVALPDLKVAAARFRGAVFYCPGNKARLEIFAKTLEGVHLRMCKETVETIHTFIQCHDKKLQQAAESEVYQRMMSVQARMCFPVTR